MGGLEEVGKWVGGNTKAVVLALNPARWGFSLGILHGWTAMEARG